MKVADSGDAEQLGVVDLRGELLGQRADRLLLTACS